MHSWRKRTVIRESSKLNRKSIPQLMGHPLDYQFWLQILVSCLFLPQLKPRTSTTIIPITLLASLFLLWELGADWNLETANLEEIRVWVTRRHYRKDLRLCVSKYYQDNRIHSEKTSKMRFFLEMCHHSYRYRKNLKNSSLSNIKPLTLQE